MKKSILVLAALALLAWGCSSDDDGTTKNPTPPTPMELPSGTDVRPSWQVPNYNLYEQTMIVDVQLQDTLVKYASTEDLLCATIGNEVRGVAVAVQNGNQWKFPLVIGSNEAGVAVSLSYYCDKLHRIFTIEWMKFDATIAPTGTDGIYKPIFIK